MGLDISIKELREQAAAESLIQLQNHELWSLKEIKGRIYLYKYIARRVKEGLVSEEECDRQGGRAELLAFYKGFIKNIRSVYKQRLVNGG